MLKIRLVMPFALLFVSACAAQSHYCDKSGECHPDKELKLSRPVLIRTVENASALHPSAKKVFAFALIETGPYCQVFLPPAKGPHDEEWRELMWHELRHCAEGNYHG